MNKLTIFSRFFLIISFVLCVPVCAMKRRNTGSPFKNFYVTQPMQPTQEQPNVPQIGNGHVPSSREVSSVFKKTKDSSDFSHWLRKEEKEKKAEQSFLDRFGEDPNYKL